MQGLHLGSGVMQYKITGEEYDGMTALWDWRRLPGLTAVYDDASLLAYSNVNSSPAVGGVSDNINSGVMLQMVQAEKLEYCKSVATFDDTIVFTLSGVNNKTACPVNTTIDSKRYTVPVEVFDNNGQRQSYSDGVHRLSGVKRIVCGSTAYTFPGGADLTLAIEEKNVAWNTITSWADGSYSGKSVTIYFSGTRAISYLVHPAEKVIDSIKSIAVGNSYHAVMDPVSNIKYLFFFAPGQAGIPGIGQVACDRKAAVMIKDKHLLLAGVEQSGSAVKFTLNGKLYTFAPPAEMYAGKSVILLR